MPNTLEDRMKTQGVPDFAAEDAKKFVVTEQEKQDWAKADGVAKVLAETPDIGLGEQAAAAATPPELRPLVADALRKKLAETKANEKIGGGMRLGLSLAKGMVNVGAPRARMVGLLPSLDPEQEKFAAELVQIRASEDPLQQPGGGIAGFLGRQVQSTAEQIVPMAEMMSAGRVGGLVFGTAGKALGFGEKAVGFAAGAGSRLGVTAGGLPQIADETYRELIVEGHDPNRAWWTTVASAPIESAIESFLPDPFKAAPNIFKGTVRQVVRKVAGEFFKRYGTELSEEALQGITRESGNEIARAIDEKIPNKGYGEILKKGWESVQGAAIPLALMLAPAGVQVTAKGAIDLAQRGAAMKEAQAARPSLQERRTERQAMEQRFKERGQAALNEPPNPQRSIPAPVAAELESQRQGNTYAPGVQAKLDDMRVKRAKGLPVSRKDGKELGLTDEQMKTQATRTKATDQLISQAQEQQNAGTISPNQRVPEEAGQVGQGGQVDSRGNVYQSGQVEGGAKPAGEVTPAQEVQVAEPWKKTLKDFIPEDQMDNEALFEEHRKSVMDAIKRGDIESHPDYPETVAKAVRDKAENPRDILDSMQKSGTATKEDIGRLLASQKNNIDARAEGVQGRDAESLSDRWVDSDTFTLMDVPVGLARSATKAEGELSVTPDAPIVIDSNKTGSGRLHGKFGSPAELLILDGKHRHAEAEKEGKSTIKAWVGDKAVDAVKKALPIPPAPTPVEAQSDIDRAVAAAMAQVEAEEAAPHVKSKGRTKVPKPVKSKGKKSEAAKAPEPTRHDAGLPVWEMTKTEFDDYVEMNGNPLRTQAHDDADFYEDAVNKALDQQRRNKQRAKAWLSFEQMAKDLQLPDDTTYWEMIQRGRQLPIPTHEEAVKRALSEGKVVPERVLADYPGLKPAPTPKVGRKGAPKKPAPKNVAEVVKAVAAQGEQEKRGTVSEAPKLEPWEMTREGYFNNPERVQADVQKSEGWKVSYKYTNPPSGGPYTGSMVVSDKPAKGDTISAPFGSAKVTSTSKAKPRKLDNMELREKGKEAHRRSVEEAVKAGKPVPAEVLKDYPDLEPTRQPSPELQAAKAEKDQARKELIRKASKFKSFLPGSVDPELALAAVKYVKAAVKFEILRFKELVKDLIRQTSKERAIELDEYLQSAWKQEGAKDHRLDKPTSVQAVLNSLEKKPTAAPKTTPLGKPVVGRKGAVYRAFDDPADAAPQDRGVSFNRDQPFGYGGGYEIEVIRPKGEEVQHHPGHEMGILNPNDVTRLFYEPGYFNENAHDAIVEDLKQLRRMFPKAEFVRVEMDLESPDEARIAVPHGEYADAVKPVPAKAAPAPKTNWQDTVSKLVTKEVTLPDLFKQLQAKHPDLTLAEFKQGLLDMANAKTITLQEYTRAEAEIAGQPEAIRVKPSRFLPNGALFYFARPGTQPVESTVKNPVPPPVQEAPKEETPPSDVGEKVGKGGETTGTKNAKTNEMRAKLGLPERPPVQPQTFEEWEAVGAGRLAANPDYARDLAEDLVANPRAVDPGDNAALGQYVTQLQNRLDAGEDVKSEMAMVIQAAELVGTEASHALASRKAERYPDLSLATFVRKHVQELGAQPSKEQLDKYAALADEIAALKAENQKLREADAKAEIEKRILEAKLAAKPKAAPKEKIGTKKERLQRQASEAVASFKSAWDEAVRAAGKHFFTTGGMNPEAIEAAGRAAKAAAAVVKAYAELGVNSFLEFISRVKTDIGPLDTDQEKLFREEWNKAVEAGEITRPVNSASEKTAIGVMAKTLTRWAVESGITETEAVIDAVHAELLSMGVNQTRSDTMDAMSGYGDFKELPHDPVSDIVRGIKGEIRAQRQLEDYQQGRAALRSGVERPTPTEAERQLRKEVNEAKKRDGIVSRDPAKELKSALDTAKTAVENAMVDTELAIESLKKAIADKTPLAKADPAPGPVDDELKSMREKLAEKRLKRKELRAEYDKLFPPKRGALTDAKRLAMAEALLKRLNEEMAAEIQSLRNGTWVPEVKKSPLTSSTLTRLQATNDALKAALKAAKEGSPAYQAELQAKEDAQYIKAQERRLAFWEKVETEARLGILPKTKPKKVRSNPQILTNDIAIKKKKDAALYEMEMEKRRQWNLGQWIFAGLNDAASLLPRALMLGLEASPLTRQGRMYLGSPSKVFPNLVRSIASVFSERMAFSQNENLRNRSNFKSGEYEAAGIDFTDASGASAKMEEIYQSAILRWLSKTEGVFWIPLRWPAKAYMASERGVQNFLNGMRADIYDTGKLRTQRIRKFFDKHGIPTEKEWSKNDVKNWGRAANIFSGRGTGIRGNAATNFFILAARWTWSTIQTEYQVPFQMATPKFIGQWNADAATRIAHAQLYAQAILAGVTHLAAVYWLMMLLADDDDETPDEPTIETDWTSTDLWKVKVGDTTIDTMGGLQQPFVFVNRIIQGRKKKRSGEIVPLRGEGSSPYKGDAWTEFTNQLLYKSGPAFSGIIEFWRQKTAIGETLPDNPLKRVAVIGGKRMIPITYPDMVQVEKNLGWKQGTVAALEAFIGSSIGTYGDRTDFLEGTPEERTKQFNKDLEEMQWDSPAPPYADLLTDEQKQQVEKRWEQRRGELVFEALRESPDERVAAAAKEKKKSPYKDAESLQTAQDRFREDQASFAALKAQVSLEEAERLLAVRYAEEMGTQPIQSDGQWLPSGSTSKNAAFKERRKALRKAYGK